jgi:hypothetical protein
MKHWMQQHMYVMNSHDEFKLACGLKEADDKLGRKG